MTTAVNISLSDYLAIARLANDSASDESREYEVEYSNGGYILFLTIDHEIEYREEIGGSCENYDFERLTVVDSEEFDVISADCYDSDGNEVFCDFQAKRLLDIVNN